jgi:hypothetical protein
VLNKVSYVSSVDDHYSLGTSLSDQDVGAVLESALGPGKLPIDTNGVYFVLTSADVSEQEFCWNACGWHAYDIYSPAGGQTVNLKVARVGNPNQCPAYCETQTPPSPNNNAAADSMASFVAHELKESVTDPLFNAWFDASISGNENADLCVWTFGDYVSLPNGAFYNMILGNRPYLIQQNWVNAKGGYCALKWGD